MAGVQIEPIREVDDVAAEWRALEAQADEAHYGLTLAWLGAWATTADRGPLSVVRVGDDALGLLERRPGGRLRFAGGPATPHRRLLCAAGREDAAYDELWNWLATRRRGVTELEASGLHPSVRLPAGAIRETQPEFALPLPAAFEEYLAARTPGTRKGLKGKLRRLEREGGAVVAVPPEDMKRALEDFVRLHEARATSKGERHAVVDGRLAAHLARLPDRGLRVRILELLVDGVTAGVTVRIDHRGTAFFYNSGIDPARAALSPGVCLELESIRDAISAGLRHFDLGPGDWRYKRDLGGEHVERVRVLAGAPSALGMAMRFARRLRGGR